LHFHRLLFQYTDGNGGQLKTDENLIVSYETGRKEVVFEPTPPEETEFMLGELLVRYEEAKTEARTHPLVLMRPWSWTFSRSTSEASTRASTTELRDSGKIKPEGSGADAGWNRV
jgi:hypothetical protein